jgi:D-sedoheptulose 7-phosphate isomerase
MRQNILTSIEDGIRAIEFLKRHDSLHFIEAAATLIADCFRSGGKLLVAGNGGSLCDAMHFAEELTGIYRARRKALPAIALSEPGHLTCVGNDLGYDQVFSRGVEAYGKPGDVFVCLTTSGNSANCVNAVAVAKTLGLKTICFLGKTGGKLKGAGDLEWIVDGFTYSDRIQEAHMTAIHIIIEMIEKQLFESIPLVECLDRMNSLNAV